jgi:hypothetical protein
MFSMTWRTPSAPTMAKPVDVRPTNETGVGAECQCDQHISSGSDAAVEQDRRLRSDRRRSCGRQPKIVVSRVMTSAAAPQCSGRPIIESTSASSVDQYS